MNQLKHAKWWRSFLDKLKQAFSYTKASQQKEKSKEKQREAKRSKEENRGQQLQSSLALLEHFPKSIFYMLYTISKLRKSRIQRFKPCTIWSWIEKDMAFGRQLHQAEGQFRTPLFKVRIPQSTVREFRTPQINVRNWNSNVRIFPCFCRLHTRSFLLDIFV